MSPLVHQRSLRRMAIHNGKQNFRCLKCNRQFVLEPSQKVIEEKAKELIRKTLLERISLEGVGRVFDVNIALVARIHRYSDCRISAEDLNTEVVKEDDEIDVVLLEADEMWSYVESQKNPQWL